jgi:hypothetical protein
MSTPAYDGKGQPPAAQRWFSGLAAWWDGLTPQYVTHAPSGTSASAQRSTRSTKAIDVPGAPAGAAGTSTDSSDGLAASGTDLPPALAAAKP